MAITKETLKKHHFWILVGVTPLLVLIAVIMIDSGVGAEIETKTKAINTAKDALKGKDAPKSEAFISKFGVQLEELGRKRTDLWKENWERQIGLAVKQVSGKDTVVQDPARNLLRWPKSGKLVRFNYGADYATNKAQLKFGDPIPNDTDEYKEFSKEEVYIAEFSNPAMKDIEREPEKRTGMADRVYPTSFAGGWAAVLRHVQTPAGWGESVPRPEQIWLVLEDIWVQRAALDAIKQVNDSIAKFYPVPRRDKDGAPQPETNLERSFASRIWRIDMKVAPRPSDNRFVMSGTLTNVTDRLQLLGAGNTLVLNVWLSSAAGAQPVQFRIGGEFVAGGATIAVSPAEDHVLPAGTSVDKIERIEQVFDTKTVPIRRIDHLALGKTDSRYAAYPLQMPLFPAFKKEAEAAEAAKAAASSSSGPGGAGGSSLGPMGGTGSSKPPGSDSGNTAAAAGQLEGGGTLESVIDGNRKRYVEATAQIRRMPVAITVIVDQAYMHDVLMAYANLPMRFQVTQYHWQRFRGSIGGGGVYGSSGSSDDIIGPARGMEGSGGIKFGSGSSLGPSPMGGSSLGPAPGGPGPKGGSSLGPSPGGPGPMGTPGGATASAPSGSFSEAQLTAGLVELTIYGIVSVYEKYEPAETAEKP
jgi:hypothetical protein